MVLVMLMLMAVMMRMVLLKLKLPLAAADSHNIASTAAATAGSASQDLSHGGVSGSVALAARYLPGLVLAGVRPIFVVGGRRRREHRLVAPLLHY